MFCDKKIKRIHTAKGELDSIKFGVEYIMATRSLSKRRLYVASETFLHLYVHGRSSIHYTQHVVLPTENTHNIHTDE